MRTSATSSSLCIVGKYHHGHPKETFRDAVNQLQPAHAGQGEVGDDEVEGFAPQEFERLEAGARLRDDLTVAHSVMQAL